VSKTFEQADDKTKRLVTQVRNEHHPGLRDNALTIDVLMVADIDEESGEVSPALKAHGYPAAATIAIVPLNRRALGQADALLTIDTATWQGLGAAEQTALVDHELTHLQIKRRDNAVVRDDLGRPKLAMRLHDWQLGGFVDVARRHGESAIEVRAARACTSKGQYFWDFGPSKLRAVGS